VWSSRSSGDVRLELIVDENGGDEARRGVELTEEEEDASSLCFVAETVSGLVLVGLAFGGCSTGRCWAMVLGSTAGLLRPGKLFSLSFFYLFSFSVL
jgi:hypothetical protein